MVVFVIQDEGPGISQEMIQNLFNQYSRQTSMLDQGKSQEGLGLAIVYKYVTAMNGKVTCESEIGKGSKFVVALPC